MTQKERIERIHEYLREWDWELFTLLPLNKADAEAIKDILDRDLREREQKARWYQEHQEEHKARATIRNRKKAADEKLRILEEHNRQSREG